MKVLAVGDIHTKTWIIDAVEKLIDGYDAVVFCGDYADDWGATATDSLNAWKRIYSFAMSYPDKFRAVRGNHDYIYTVKTPTLQSGYDHATQLLINDPANKALKDWLKVLPLTVKIDGVTYSHAGIDKRWDGKLTVEDLWNNTSPIWTRPEWAEYKKMPQVFGHTPHSTCIEVQPNVWCIDTFSTYRDGTPIGDQTMLEVTDGKVFSKIEIKDCGDLAYFLRTEVSK